MAEVSHLVNRPVAGDVNNNENKEKIFHKARGKIRALFYWQTLGLVFSLGALLAVQMLQTSINIKGRVGSISVTAAFFTSIFVCLFVCPTVLEKFGPTTSLILSELCYLIYCACNFYPELYVLLPGAIFSGIGRALFVPSYSIIIIRLTQHCAKYATSKKESHYFDQFQSRYYCLNEFVQIIGNGLSYAILRGTHNQQNTNDASITFNSSSSSITNDYANNSLYHYCGVNDCQEEAVLEQSLHQYVPPTKTSVYIFLSSTVMLGLLGIVIHCTLFPGIGAFSHKLGKIELQVRKKLALYGASNKVTKDEGDCFIANASLNISGELSMEEKSPVSNGYNEIHDHRKDEVITVNCNSQKVMKKRKAATLEDQNRQGYWNTVKATLLFMVRGRALLLGIASLHCGMLIGFAFADLTRAYASCLAGVQMTGAFATSFGLAGMVSSLIYGKILPRFGRFSLYVAASTLELGIYALCYLWEPDPNALYVVFIIFIGVGLANGILRQNVIAAFTLHFPNDKNRALTAFNTAYTGGIGIQYGLSTFMCVSMKIYTQIAVTMIAILFYLIAELIRNEQLRTNGKADDKVNV